MPVIALRRTMARKANTIGKYAAEKCNAATKRFKASHDFGQSTVQEALRPIKESRGGCGPTEHVQNDIIKFGNRFVQTFRHRPEVSR